MASLFIRTYTFVDGTTAYGSQVESEIGNIVTVLNNLNTAVTTWGQVSALHATSVPLVADCSSGSQHIADFKNNSVIKASVSSDGTITSTKTTNQVVLGTTNTVTISSTAPSASRTYTIVDAGGAADFVMTAGSQSITGQKTFTAPILGAASATSLTFSSTSGIVGTTTNDSAATGSVGQFVQVNCPTGGSATPGASTAFTNVTSVSLTAGDWDVCATGRLDTGGTWAGTTYQMGLSLTSGAADVTNSGAFVVHITTAGTIPASSVQLFSVGTRRFSLSGTATVYLVGSLTYTTLGATVWGADSTILARRVR